MNRPENVSTKLACSLAGEIVRTFGEVRLRVLGTSMVPAIRPGDLLSVGPAGVMEVSAGEIVVFAREGRLIVHRVMVRTSGGCKPSLVTRGDRLHDDDSPVTSSELLGRVCSIERGDKQMQPAACLSGWERLIVRLLRHSDLATNLYVRLVRLRFVGAGHPSLPLGTSAVLLRFDGTKQSARSAECQV